MAHPEQCVLLGRLDQLLGQGRRSGWLWRTDNEVFTAARAAVIETQHVERLATLAVRRVASAERLLGAVADGTAGCRSISAAARAMATTLRSGRIATSAESAESRRWQWFTDRAANGLPVGYSYHGVFRALLDPLDADQRAWAAGQINHLARHGDRYARVAERLWLRPFDIDAADSRRAAAARLLLRSGGSFHEAIAGPWARLEDCLVTLLAWHNDPYAACRLSHVSSDLIRPDEAVEFVRYLLPFSAWQHEAEDLRQKALARLVRVLPTHFDGGDGRGLLRLICARVGCNEATRRLAVDAVVREERLCDTDIYARCLAGRAPVSEAHRREAATAIETGQPQAIRAVQSFNRRFATMRQLEQNLRDESLAEEMSGLLAGLGPDWRTILGEIVATLTPGEAEVIEQSFLGGYKLWQVAENLGLTLASVKARRRRGLQKAMAFARRRWAEMFPEQPYPGAETV